MSKNLEKLAEKVAGHADTVAAWIAERGEQDHDFGPVTLQVCRYRPNCMNGVTMCHGLHFGSAEVDYDAIHEQAEAGIVGDLTAGEVGDGESCHYLTGDFHCQQVYPTPAALRLFAEHWQAISDHIDETDEAEDESDAKLAESL